LFEELNPRDPAGVALVAEFALAFSQFRRAFGLDPEALARNPRDMVAIGTFESRCTRILYRAIPGIENLEKQAAKRKSGKQTPELIEDKENATVSEANFPPRRALE
jgi:hypothetical protein